MDRHCRSEKLRRHTMRVLALVTMVAPFLAALDAAPKTSAERSGIDNPQLARVSIVRYEDRTGEKNFGYMPDSLTEAIDKSLRQRFEYHREDPQKTAAAMDVFQKKNGRLDAAGAVDFCRTNKSDILIFGDFVFDAQKNVILVRTAISMGVQVNFRELKMRSNAVDASIFGLADLVADDIVKTLIEIAEEQVSKMPATEKKEQKMQLYKSEVVTWVEPNWNLFIGASGAIPLSTAFSNYRNIQPTFSVFLERRMYRRFFMGITTGTTRIRAAEVSLDMYEAAVLLGYHIHLSNRWDIFGAAGAGYYLGKYNNNTTCTALCPNLGVKESLTVYNPHFTGRLGVNFLMVQWLSLSAFVQGDVFYDRPSPLYFAGGGLAIGVHF